MLSHSEFYNVVKSTPIIAVDFLIFDNESNLMAQKSQIAGLTDKLHTFRNLYQDVQRKYEDSMIRDAAIREKARIAKQKQRAKKKEANK